MITLPPIRDLIQRTKALAALDLILSPEWQYRYYSFNSNWAPLEQMASIRDGCGDEWWIVFHESGWAALKGLGHESEAWSEGRELLSAAIQGAFPAELHGFTHEPAFRWDSTSFGYFQLPEIGAWKCANTATPFASLDSGDVGLLSLLTGGAEAYVQFAAEYFEADIPLDGAQHIFAHLPITEEIVASLNSETSLEEIAEELFNEIGYPR